MSVSIIRKVYDEFRLTFENTPDFIIEFYSKNALILKNIYTFENTDDLKIYIELISKFAEALYFKRRFNEVLSYLDKCLNMINSEITRLNAPSVKNDWYYNILSVKAMSLYSVQDFKGSASLFKILIDQDPKNELYKNWYRYANYGLRSRYVKFIIILAALLLFAGTFFKSFIHYPLFKTLTTSTALLIITVSTCYDYYIKRSFKKAAR